LKGLPLAYNRDLQEDKEPLFDALDQCRLTLGPCRAPRTAEIVPARMQERPTAARGRRRPGRVLVQRGIPFRDAHARVGELVRHSAERGVPLDELVLTEPDLDRRRWRCSNPGPAVQRRTTPGGAGPGSVEEQLVKARARLEEAGPLAAAPRLSRARVLSRSFYGRGALDLAPELLKQAARPAQPPTAGGSRPGSSRWRLSRVDDPGSHAYRA